MNHGIIEAAALSPTSIRAGDPGFNTDRMLELIHVINGQNRAGERQIRIAAFPELCVTGYNAGEFFSQTALLDNAKEALTRFIKESKDEYNPLIIVGMPLRKDNQLFNCAIIIHFGKVLGVVPKTYLPNYSVLYEARYFSPSFNRLNDEIELLGERVPFTPNLLFEDKSCGAVTGVELCEDLWMPLPPSAYHCLHGANVVVNLSSSNQTFGKTAYREDLLRIHSSICTCGYIYTCAAADETTRDSVFAGHNMVVDNGKIVAETKFMENGDFTFGEIDIEKAAGERAKRGSYMAMPDKKEYKKVYFETFALKTSKFISRREFPLLPFVPRNDGESAEILGLAATGLAQRLKKNRYDSVLIEANETPGSLLAIFAAAEAFKLNGYSSKNIILTGQKLKPLAQFLNITCSDAAPVGETLSVGTADMTDIAINGNNDDMRVYPLCASIPKTAVSPTALYCASKHGGEVQKIAAGICGGNDTHPYAIYDFILYNMLAYGFSPKKIYDLYTNSMALNAERTGCKPKFDDRTVLDEMKTFYSRFLSPKIRRSPMPDCIKIFAASLSAKDFRMPDETTAEVWLKGLEG